MKYWSRVWWRSWTAFIFLCSGLPWAFAAGLDEPGDFDIPAGIALDEALLRWSGSAHIQVMFTSHEVENFESGGVRGALSPRTALTSLLKNSGLTYSVKGDRMVTIIPSSDSKHTTGNSLNETPAISDGPKGSSGGEMFQPEAQPPPGGPSGKTEGLSRINLEEVLVTGSRIPTPQGQPVANVRIYSREQIAESGQTTLSDFFNTLPGISTSTTEAGETFGGATTVRLHGLPQGTTLVLINGRRVQSTGAQAFSDIFDLNSIPVSAVDRIDILPTGSSAVYGSDAVAGVVNIILKRDFTDTDARASYGAASGVHQSIVSTAFGTEWAHSSLSVIASYLTRNSLLGAQRSITDSYDRQPYNPADLSSTNCAHANVYSVDGSTPIPGLGGALLAGASGNTLGVPTTSLFVPNALNRCAYYAGFSLIPATRRGNVIVQGDLDFTQTVQGYTELIYSHVRQDSAGAAQGYYQAFTLSGANPYNPFGADVALSGSLADSVQHDVLATDFYRALAGVRGRLAGTWSWDLATWLSGDKTRESDSNSVLDYAGLQGALDSTDPASAVNPFAAHNGGKSQPTSAFLSGQNNTSSGRLWTVNAFAEGEALQLPSGPMSVVVGSEFNRSNLTYQPMGLTLKASRTSYSVFGEARVPLVGPLGTNRTSPILEAHIAGRFDHYDDFGGTTTPQFLLNWRPIETVTVHAGYGKSFKAPPLANLHLAPTSYPGLPFVDPLTGATDTATLVFGGNPNLKPTTGKSQAYGIAYEDSSRSGFSASVTGWRIDETGAIQSIVGQTIVDNSALFPGAVVRDGPGGAISQVNAQYVNFGNISVAGIDYDAGYQLNTRIGSLRPSASVTQIYRYQAALIPGAPTTDRVGMANDDGNFAPRWKGVAAIDWNYRFFSLHVAERYTAHYADYDSTRLIGGQGYLDFNLRFQFADHLPVGGLKRATLELGAINAFDKLPAYSNYAGGLFGYDVRESEIRGRFLYAAVEAKF